MMMCCPTCRQPLADHEIPVEMLAEFDFTPKEKVMLRALAAAYPKSLSTDQIIAALYGNDIDGGPVTADRIVHQFACRMRRRLPEFGWQIPRHGGGRGNKGEYRLVPIAGAKA